MNIAITFATLVKTNNGEFQSIMQKHTCQQYMENNQFSTTGFIRNNGWTLTYFCDDNGITKVEKFTHTKGKTTLEWEKVTEGKIAIQDQKTIKRLKSTIKQFQKQVASRQEGLDNNWYADPIMMQESIDTYNNSIKECQEIINKILHPY